MSDELKHFYKAKEKSKQINQYGYDDDGNLVERNKEGTVIKTILLPNYRKPTYEEYDEMEKKRMEEIAVVNKEYEDIRKMLREVYANPSSMDSEIIKLNRKVIESDIKLQTKRFPLHYIMSEDGFEIRQIDFDQPNEKRKFPYALSFLETRPFTLQDQYVRIGKTPEKPLISVAEANANTQPIILFSEPDTNMYGYLSLKWAVELEFNGTMYNSAKQAISAEIAKSLNDQVNLNKIMLAETPDLINYKLSDISDNINEIKWIALLRRIVYEVNIAKFNQYPELTARLLETKDAILGAYEPDDNLIGIGISLDNIQSKNKVNWTGQNILGKALMDIRDKIKTERAVKQGVIRAPRKKKKIIAPITSVPVTSVPVTSVPITSVPVTSVPVTPVSVTSVPVTSVAPRTIRRRPKSAVQSTIQETNKEIVSNT